MFQDSKRCGHRGHVYAIQRLHYQVSAVEEDLMTYVQWRVASSEFLRQRVELKGGLMKSILDTVVKENDGMFLLAKFNMDTLASKLRPAEVVKALKSLPKELDGTYTDAMLRVADLPASYREVMMKLLRWVVFAEQPLKMREIEHAIAVTEGDCDIDRDDIIRANVIASKCTGLVVFDESDRLRLVHFSAEYFFNRNRDRWFPEGPKTLASTCLTYLLFDTFLGPNKLVMELLAKGVDPNIKDMNGTTPLALATKTSNVDVALMLIRAGAALNAMDNIGAAPLHKAARHGQEEMVKLLVEQDRIAINIMHTRWSQQAPLMIASTYGYTGVIRLLLDAPQLNINQECSDPQGATALILAALSSEADAVQLLLTHSAVNVNHQDHSGTTALIYAAHRGDRKVAEKEQTPGFAKMTREGQRYIVQLIKMQSLSQSYCSDVGANVHHKDAFGRSPLHTAACNGRTKIMRILLEFDKSLDVNMQEKNGETTLHDVALCAHMDTARFLLEHGADSTIRDHHDRTPMRIAQEMNEIAIMELLRTSQEKESHKQPGKFEPLPLQRNNTALSIDSLLSLWALVESNLKEEVRARLSNNPSTEINLRDPDLGQTTLHHSTANNNIEVVEMLVSYSADLNIGNTWERKSLHLATLHNYAGSAEIILKAGAEIDAKDHWGHTPLMISSISRLSIATLLVSNGADISDSRLNLNKILGLAAENGNRVAVHRLVESGAELWRKNSVGY
ncbi:hypothetical protein N8T08_006327 [Aspergillus melleus]|uniref:Uncharacterized protein n=1 Tax=Aspergillus melleus TaxID=138277 RepID=A0ACC3B000_9EURO|nr:hypothetical protein N8T08_006327 [Aspergillus melleus]